MCRDGIFFHKRRSLVNFVCYQEYTVVVSKFFVLIVFVLQ